MTTENEVTQEVTPETQEVSDTEKLRAELQRQEENKRKAQQRESQKDQRIRQLEESLKSTVSREDFNNLRLEMAMIQETQVEEKPSGRIDQLKQQIKEEEAKVNQQRQFETYKSRVESMQQKAIDAGFDIDDDSFDPVLNMISMGRLDAAEKRLEKIIGKEEKPKVNEEERMAKLRADIEAEIIKKYGLGTQEPGGPSAPSISDMDIERKYAAGEISTGTYREYLDKKQKL